MHGNGGGWGAGALKRAQTNWHVAVKSQCKTDGSNGSFQWCNISVFYCPIN